MASLAAAGRTDGRGGRTRRWSLEKPTRHLWEQGIGWVVISPRLSNGQTAFTRIENCKQLGRVKVGTPSVIENSEIIRLDADDPLDLAGREVGILRITSTKLNDHG